MKQYPRMKLPKSERLRHLAVGVVTAMLTMSAYMSSAMADFSNTPGYGHSHMNWGDGMGMMMFGPVMMIGLVVLIVLVVVSLVQRKSHANGRADQATSSALELLNERYAKGEIDHDEYAERKRRLME